MKKKTRYQAVSNKLDVGFAPKQLQNLRKFEKVLISERILFKNIALIHGKRELAKIKGNICNMSVETDIVMCCQDL